MKKKKIKQNAFKNAMHFTGTGAEYARSMIAPQDEKMYEWLNERIRVGRFGTKQMTQLIEYALDNPTPEFFAYVMSKFLRHFGVDHWNFAFRFDPGHYGEYLKSNAENAKELLKIATDEVEIKRLTKDINDWEEWQDNQKRWCRFTECFLHDEEWSVEQELEIGRRRNEVKQTWSRVESIRRHYDLLVDCDFDETTAFNDSKLSEEFQRWKANTPAHFLNLVKQQTEKSTTKSLLDEAEGRACTVYSSNKDVIYYERTTND